MAKALGQCKEMPPPTSVGAPCASRLPVSASSATCSRFMLSTGTMKASQFLSMRPRHCSAGPAGTRHSCSASASRFKGTSKSRKTSFEAGACRSASHQPRRVEQQASWIPSPCRPVGSRACRRRLRSSGIPKQPLRAVPDEIAVLGQVDSGLCATSPAFTQRDTTFRSHRTSCSPGSPSNRLGTRSSRRSRRYVWDSCSRAWWACAASSESRTSAAAPGRRRSA